MHYGLGEKLMVNVWFSYIHYFSILIIKTLKEKKKVGWAKGWESGQAYT